MLYKIAHILRDKLSWLWNIIEWINGVLFSLRYGSKLKGLKCTVVPEGYEMVPIRNIPTDRMVEFFARQPEEAFTYFKPHGFDWKSLRRLQKNKSFLGYVLPDKTNGQIAGYCFNRCFFSRSGFPWRDGGYRLSWEGNMICNRLIL